MSQKFVLFSSQRSGSSYLMKALDDHPQVMCAGAIFRKSKNVRMKYPELIFDYQEKKKSKLYKYFKKRIITKHLQKVFSFGKSESKGFRLMANQAEDFPSIIKTCKKMDAKAIVLIRKNIVRQAISLTIAQNAGHWIKPEPGSDENIKIELDIQRLGKNIDYFQRCRTILENEKFTIDPLKVYFEDLTGPNSAKTIEKVYKYIGVLSEYQPKIHAIKKSKDPLKKRIVNFDEVNAFVKKKGLEAFVTDE